MISLSIQDITTWSKQKIYQYLEYKAIDKLFENIAKWPNFVIFIYVYNATRLYMGERIMAWKLKHITLKKVYFERVWSILNSFFVFQLRKY